MKHFIAIFFSLLSVVANAADFVVVGSTVPQMVSVGPSSSSVGKIQGCRTDSGGGTSNDWLNVGSTHIDCDGGDCSNKSFTTIGAVFERTRYQDPIVFRCEIASGLGDDKWNNEGQVLACSGAAYPQSATNAHSALYKITDNTIVFEGDFTTAEVYFEGRDYCVGYACDHGFDLIGGVCKDSANKKDVCELASSYGQWDGSKCLCGTDDRTDDKGDGQTYDTPGATCKCATSGHEWSDAQGKCVDPNAAAMENCKNSGGVWNNGVCACDANLGLGGPDGDGKCYCSAPGKTYDPAASQCVDSDQVKCTQTGGTWDAAATKCTCDANKNLKSANGNKTCECKNEDYEWENPTSNGCKLTDAASRRNTAFDQLMAECTKWGGTWVPAANSTDARDPAKWKCTCPSDDSVVGTTDNLSCRCAPGYVPDEPYKCKLSDYDTDKGNCDDAIKGSANVRWVDLGTHLGRQIGECRCVNPAQVYDYAEKKCVDGAGIKWCNLIQGAIIGRDGRCVCSATGRAPVQNKCPAVGGAAAQTPAPVDNNRAKLQQAANAKKQAIADISKTLGEISDSFGRSHWKNADGKFNTARLASDSVAGVVLGTVGGVVTSRVIKKNQIKGGFENINCAVGGQNVADYGDQFQVGIR